MSKMDEIDYFKENSERDILTHTATKEAIVGYEEYLIKNNLPFGAVKLNIDNFKLVNDAFGRATADKFLVKLASILLAETPGAVGRLDGDEFLIIIPDDVSYEDLWAYLKGIYDIHIRKNDFSVTTALNFRMTCTSGGAIFPDNAKTREELDLCMAKALYRGKKKGRNCFIIYVEDKHKDIDPFRKNLDSICDDMFELHEILSKAKDPYSKITSAIDYMCNALTIQGGYFISNGDIAVKGKMSYNLLGFDDEMLKPLIRANGLFACNNYAFLKEKSPELHDFCVDNRIYALIVSEVKYEGEVMGYLVFIDSMLKRVWQEHDRALVSFIAKSMAYLLNM